MIDLFTLFGGLPESLTGTSDAWHARHRVEASRVLLRYHGGGTGYIYASTTELKHHDVEIVGTRGSVLPPRQDECLPDAIPIISAAPDENIWRRPEIRDVTPAVAEVPINRLQGMAGNFSRHIRYDDSLRCDAESACLSLELAMPSPSFHLGGSRCRSTARFTSAAGRTARRKPPWAMPARVAGNRPRLVASPNSAGINIRNL